MVALWLQNVTGVVVDFKTTIIIPKKEQEFCVFRSKFSLHGHLFNINEKRCFVLQESQITPERLLSKSGPFGILEFED